MIRRTESIVLRHMDYRETSSIVTLFTREMGKVTVLAKGSRVPKSRFGSTLQPLSYIQSVFYHKPTRTLQTLSEATHLHRFTQVGARLEKLTVGLRLLELVNALTEDEESNPSLFNLLLHTLERLDAADARAENVLPYFQLRLAELLGFAPDIDREQVKALTEAGGVLLLDTGRIYPLAAARGAGERASRAALRAFAICARADLDTVLRMHLDPDVAQVLMRLVEAYLRTHVGAAYPSRSDAVMAQLRASS